MNVPFGSRRLVVTFVSSQVPRREDPAALGATDSELVRLGARAEVHDRTLEVMRLLYGWPTSRR